MKDKSQNPFHGAEEVCIHCKYNYSNHFCYCTQFKCDCMGKICDSYKSKRKKHEEDIKWAERIGSLPEEKQEQIALMYYHGQRPWKWIK